MNKPNLTAAEKKEHIAVMAFTFAFHIAFFIFAYFALLTPVNEKQHRSNHPLTTHKMP
jgi:hypothetical protein